MAAPHIAGAAALLWPLFTGWPTRVRPLGVRAMLLNSTDDTGWAADRGWGFANLTTLQSQLNVVNDSVAPAGQVNSFKLFRGTATTGAKATLTWNRHVTGAAASLSNLDLLLYDRANNQQSASRSGVDNVEQVVAPQPGAVVVKVKSLTPVYPSGQAAESFALAFANSGFQLARGPVLALTCTAPATVQPGSSLTITCAAGNSGDLEAFAPQFTLSPVGPAQPPVQSGATLSPGTSASVSWTVTAPPSGTYSLTAALTSTSFGEQYSAAQTLSLLVASPPAAAPALASKPGVFRNGLWVWDTNGSGLFEGLGAGQDSAFFLGQPGDVGIIGDWNGSGTKKAGVFRSGLWVLDYNGNQGWDGLVIDRAFNFGQTGDKVVVGDWTGDGRDKLGLFRNGLFYLDVQGNGTFSRGIVLGQAGDTPVVGDWNGSGTKKVGVFRNGLWVVDYNGNGVWDGLGSDRTFFLGAAGDVPVVGDWNGDTRAKAGVFRNGLWALDYNGNGGWDGPAVDRAYFGGQAGDTPVVGDWTGTGITRVGYFHAGTWWIDTTGDGSFVRPLYLGQANDTILVGRW